MNNFDRFFNELEIFDVGLTKIRIGAKNDGGYVLMKELTESTRILFSFGIGNDMEFELDLVGRLPKLHGYLFDPYIDELPAQHKRLHFHKKDAGFGFKMMRSLLEDIREGSILKMDIEWNEWHVLSRMGLGMLTLFDQIVVEFHIMHCQTPTNLSPYFTTFYSSVYDSMNEDRFGQYADVLRRMNEVFFITHVHANNSLPMSEIGGYRFPPLLELTFTRKDLVRYWTQPMFDFPQAQVDRPNKLDRPDILNYYPFTKKGTS